MEKDETQILVHRMDLQQQHQRDNEDGNNANVEANEFVSELGYTKRHKTPKINNCEGGTIKKRMDVSYDRKKWSILGEKAK